MIKKEEMSSLSLVSTMAQHGISWYSMVYCGIAWYEKLISFYVVLRGILWCNFLNHFFYTTLYHMPMP